MIAEFPFKRRNRSEKPLVADRIERGDPEGGKCGRPYLNRGRCRAKRFNFHQGGTARAAEPPHRKVFDHAVDEGARKALAHRKCVSQCVVRDTRESPVAGSAKNLRCLRQARPKFFGACAGNC